MTSMRTVLVFGVVTCAIAATIAACGSQPASPAQSPTSPTTTTSAPAATGGATISGVVTVLSSASSASRLLASTTTAVVVTVVGTAISSVADSGGRFRLTGVPAGSVELKFSGNGQQGSVTLTDVKDADDISVVVTLGTTGASLQTEDRSTDGVVEIEGRIAAVNPGNAANTLLVDSIKVSVPASAEIRHGSTAVPFTALAVGDRVHVRGTKTGDTIIADLVIDQNDNSNVPVNLNGAVSQLQSGFSCPNIRFTLEGWTVETSAATSFEKGPCLGIRPGTSVHVKGTVQSSGLVLATWVQTGK
jgi:Domain of unknown function (DUF5666)